jgi:hypothetical protein
MSLYSYNFDLLPKPLRSSFSFGSESTRATIPDFENVAQLSQFTHHLTNYYIDMRGIFTQCRIITALLTIVIAIDVLVIARRIWQRTFWIFRIIKRPEGSFLVPNSILVFSVVEGIFGVIYTAYTWSLLNHSRDRTAPPANTLLWFTVSFLVPCRLAQASLILFIVLSAASMVCSRIRRCVGCVGHLFCYPQFSSLNE